MLIVSADMLIIGPNLICSIYELLLSIIVIQHVILM